MEQSICACGCGQTMPKFDRKKRLRKYIQGHQNKNPTELQRQTMRENLKRSATDPWNKGKSYVFKKREVYAHKGTWMKAVKRLFPDACMRCNWDQAPCDTHHIVPKRNGGQYTLDNGILLCPNCHRLADLGRITSDELRGIRDRATPQVESI